MEGSLMILIRARSALTGVSSKRVMRLLTRRLLPLHQHSHLHQSKQNKTSKPLREVLTERHRHSNKTPFSHLSHWQACPSKIPLSHLSPSQACPHRHPHSSKVSLPTPRSVSSSQRCLRCPQCQRCPSCKPMASLKPNTTKCLKTNRR